MTAEPEPTRAQRRIVWGSKFAVIVPQRQHIVFGAIPTLDDACRQDGRLVEGFHGQYDRGDRVAACYTPDSNTGDMCVYNIVEMRPLTDDQFETARAADWSIFALSSTDKGREVLRAVFTDPRWEGPRD